MGCLAGFLNAREVAKRMSKAIVGDRTGHAKSEGFGCLPRSDQGPANDPYGALPPPAARLKPSWSVPFSG
jgi:hypothetical protein